MQLYPGLFLKITDHAEQIPRLWIDARAEHSDQTFGRRARRFAELFEANGRLDIVAQPVEWVALRNPSLRYEIAERLGPASIGSMVHSAIPIASSRQHRRPARNAVG